DEVYYNEDFPQRGGASLYLSDYSSDYNLAGNWAPSIHSFGDGDLGTPGYGVNDSLSVNPLAVPDQMILLNNYPNPFNGKTKIEFHVLTAAQIKLAIYNLVGQEVVVLQDKYLEPGEYTITWGADNLSTGIYLVRLTIDDVNLAVARKILFLK
ncbi:MAG: T9SS type A sorting domain-containing protein, partial [Candidatus Marinimicrobia bacterium]|nr:T9SS type A sorting domain-containing protein [Candidatus Neomarinimicrobiota bacterium]